MDTNLILRQATLAAQASDKVQARALLKGVIQQEPRNEAAWLLYAEVAEKEEHSIYCLLKVLELDPSNESAKSRLNALRHQTSPVVSRQQAPQGRHEQLATFGTYATLVCVTLIVVAMLVFGRGLSTTTVVSPTLTPIRKPPSALCPIVDNVNASRYIYAIKALSTRTTEMNTRLLSSFDRYANGTVSLSIFALDVQDAISEQQEVYDEMNALTPPQWLIEYHQKLTGSASSYLSGLRSLYLYTQTLDETYADAAMTLISASINDSTKSKAELQQIIDQCTP